jgi:hypothetical protein
LFIPDAIWRERENAIVNSIMSGNNACGTLNKALSYGNLDEFLRKMIRPSLCIYWQEALGLRRQRDDALRESEDRRRVLAEVAANVPLSGPLAQRVDEAARVTSRTCLASI